MCPEVTMPQLTVRLFVPLEISKVLHPQNLRRPLNVIQQRGRPDKALVAHQLFRVKLPVRPAEDPVTLCRDLTQRVIDRHAVLLSARNYRLPRRACSASIASNNARKLPLPKPRLPARWIIS